MTTWPTTPLILGGTGRGARFTKVPSATSPWNLAHRNGGGQTQNKPCRQRLRGRQRTRLSHHGGRRP
eukprot:1863110-Lingulodinium_polyedra.AAC.1